MRSIDSVKVSRWSDRTFDRAWEDLWQAKWRYGWKVPADMPRFWFDRWVILDAERQRRYAQLRIPRQADSRYPLR